jgi:hypothetical protein
MIYSIVMFGVWWRVMDGHRICAVCATKDEAAAWIAGQPATGEVMAW